MFVFYGICKQLAESETEESEYETFNTFFADEKEILSNSRRYGEVTSPSSKVIGSPHISYFQMTVSCLKRRVLKIFEGEFRLNLSRSSLDGRNNHTTTTITPSPNEIVDVLHLQAVFINKILTKHSKALD